MKPSKQSRLKHFEGIHLEGLSETENARILDKVGERFLRVCEKYIDVGDTGKLAMLTALDVLLPPNTESTCAACGSSIVHWERLPVLIAGSVLKVHSKGVSPDELQALAAKVSERLRAAQSVPKSWNADTARLAFGVAMDFTRQLEQSDTPPAS